MQEAEILRYTIHHSAKANDDDVVNDFAEYYVRWGIHNQIIDTSQQRVNSRQSTVVLTVRPNGSFPLSGDFNITDEITPSLFIRSEPTTSKPR